MSREAEVIQRTVGDPVTLDRLRGDLIRLGVRSENLLFVHSSLSSLGFVPGGAQAVLEALITAVGPNRTVIVPTFTSHLSDPSTWKNPPVPRSWFEAIRYGMTPFDPAKTPSRGMGAISEQVRTTSGALRSSHPHVSFAALGPAAPDIVAPHPIQAWLGNDSPLQRLYEADAKVLFLGTRYKTCTAFHLAQHRAGKLTFTQNGAPVLANGSRQWLTFDAPVYDTADFETLGSAMEASIPVATGNVGMAVCRLFSLRAAVDFAAQRIALRSRS